MIFSLNNGSLKQLKPDFTFNELQFEKLIFGSENIHELNHKVFNEAFLYLGRQTSKDQDFETFYGIDVNGRGVVFEFKKGESQHFMGTQCLKSVNMVTSLCGVDYLNFCLKRKITDDEMYTVKQFINCEMSEINFSSRVVLMARSFDPSVFNFGNWLSENEISFKAIKYFATKIQNELFVDFSTEYETYSEYANFFKMGKEVKQTINFDRKPTFFFHDIGHDDEKWWNFLQKANVITASYDNVESPACRGYQILNQYVPGDTVIAFSKENGVVGFGTVTSRGYYYKNHDMKEYTDSNYHTMSVQWEAVLPFSQAISMNKINEMGLTTPVQTRQEIRFNKGVIDALLNEIKNCFNKKKVA